MLYHLVFCSEMGSVVDKPPARSSVQDIRVIDDTSQESSSVQRDVGTPAQRARDVSTPTNGQEQLAVPHQPNVVDDVISVDEEVQTEHEEATAIFPVFAKFSLCIAYTHYASAASHGPVRQLCHPR